MDGKFHLKSGTGNDPPPPVTGQSPTFSSFFIAPLRDHINDDCLSCGRDVFYQNRINHFTK